MCTYLEASCQCLYSRTHTHTHTHTYPRVPILPSCQCLVKHTHTHTLALKEAGGGALGQCECVKCVSVSLFWCVDVLHCQSACDGRLRDDAELVAVLCSRQHASAYVTAYVSIRHMRNSLPYSAHVSMRQHMSAYVSIRKHTSYAELFAILCNILMYVSP